MKQGLLLLLSASLLLTGCEDDWDPPPPPAPTAIDVITITGNLHRLNGSYTTTCIYSSDGDYEIINTFSANNYSQEYLYYVSADGSCSGGVYSTEKWVGTISVFDEIVSIEGWIDGDENLVPLPEANSGISIGPRAPYTAMIERDAAHYIDGELIPFDPGTSPAQFATQRAWYHYLIVDDTRGGPIRFWEVFCEVLGDLTCKEYALFTYPFMKL